MPGGGGRHGQCRRTRPARVGRTAEQLGSVDALVHCAGGAVPGSLLDIDPATWHAAFDVHLHALFYLCRAAVPWMKRRREGAIVLISSVAGLRGCILRAGLPGGQGGLAAVRPGPGPRAGRGQHPRQLRAPGIIRTRFHDAMTPQQKQLNLDQRIPLHREGTPQQVATLIAEVVKNDYLTGETFTIDGGLTMRIA